MTPPDLTLYYHPLSSYCWKALIALYENGRPFEKRLIDLGNARDSAELEALWPIRKFPVLRDASQKRDLPESSILIEYLDRYHPGPRRMIPDGFDAALEVRLWDRIFDNYVNGPMQRIVADRIHGSKGDMSGERSMLEKAYGMVEHRLEGRDWVCGDFSMAECAAAPALFYAATVQAFPDGAKNLEAYFERLMARPSVKRVIAEARPYFEMYPFKENVAERFL